jgi:hypothetical protein
VFVVTCFLVHCKSHGKRPVIERDNRGHQELPKSLCREHERVQHGHQYSYVLDVSMGAGLHHIRAFYFLIPPSMWYIACWPSPCLPFLADLSVEAL